MPFTIQTNDIVISLSGVLISRKDAKVILSEVEVILSEVEVILSEVEVILSEVEGSRKGAKVIHPAFSGTVNTNDDYPLCHTEVRGMTN